MAASNTDQAVDYFKVDPITQVSAKPEAFDLHAILGGRVAHIDVARVQDLLGQGHQQEITQRPAPRGLGF